MTQGIHRSTIFSHNLASPFRYIGRRMIGKGLDGSHVTATFGDHLITMIALGLLPVTVLVGAPLKTLYDITTRKEVSEADIEQAKEKIGGMTFKEVRKLSMILAEYVEAQCSGYESNSLLAKIYSIMIRTDERIKALRTGKNPLLKKGEVTVEIIRELEDDLKRYSDDLFERERAEIVELLVAYLDAPENQGKNLQHFMTDTVLGMTTENTLQTVKL